MSVSWELPDGQWRPSGAREINSKSAHSALVRSGFLVCVLYSFFFFSDRKLSEFSLLFVCMNFTAGSSLVSPPQKRLRSSYSHEASCRNWEWESAFAFLFGFWLNSVLTHQKLFLLIHLFSSLNVYGADSLKKNPSWIFQWNTFFPPMLTGLYLCQSLLHIVNNARQHPSSVYVCFYSLNSLEAYGSSTAMISCICVLELHCLNILSSHMSLLSFL